MSEMNILPHCFYFFFLSALTDLKGKVNDLDHKLIRATLLPSAVSKGFLTKLLHRVVHHQRKEAAEQLSRNVVISQNSPQRSFPITPLENDVFNMGFHRSPG